MLKMSGLEPVFSTLASLYLLLTLVAVCTAMWKGKTRSRKLTYAGVVLALFVVPIAPEIYRSIEYRGRLAKASALFEERCKTAGETIYKSVDEVEGVTLVNPRVQKIQGVDEADQNWGGAGLPQESTGSQFIANFLFYDLPGMGSAVRTLSPGGTPSGHGTIATVVVPTGKPGYRYVEVENLGVRIRYSLRPPSSYQLRADPLEAYAVREVAKDKPPRYAISYENISDPEGRANWIAGSRIKVFDKQSGEVFGELVQFSFEAGFGSRAGFRQPWAFAKQCTPADPTARQIGAVRYFAQKILKPASGN